VYDPWIDRDEAEHEYGIRPIARVRDGVYDAAVVAVGHKEFREQGIDAVRKACKKNHVVYDIKYVFSAADTDGRL
jgi:UDP-N-acetyl-D-galactosamine dehydrogenase